MIMMWTALESEEQLTEIKSRSFEQPVVIFKHSTRCSTSSMVKSRLERSEAPEGFGFYYLDLIRYRSVSNLVAETFGVQHESPQVLVIRNGACVYDESHMAIRMEELPEMS
ncbi:bacillithiol system redox-active protein YtxJ [Chitinophaga sp. GCM10012297]|uniref:Bacillithiol system redox-active protein YtxJ n=1 Tax=Chitinophaga chungangae TaxID=2821488 RepID=A0ABS3YLK2_9BACT|nr:bacillithiol system redox-active protein YtxJ [Chitinophaga chungangae]MBO9155290.1 bacillithiol system redox-active protein YtxJ [Chitinophaga chungangae]